MQQLSAEWFDARKGRITGSRIGAVLGLSPYSTRADVMREMVREYFGAEREFSGNVATAYGSDRESAAKADYELMTGQKVQEVGLIVHPVHDWLAASPDGLVGDDGGVEIKCPYSGKLKTLAEQPHYEAQIRLCMEVTGRSTWHYYAWTDGRDHLETVAREYEWFPLVLPNLAAFMNEFHGITQDSEKAAPYLAPKAMDLSRDARWQEAAFDYKNAKARLEAATEDLEHAKKVLIEIAADCNATKAVGCGVQAYQSERKGSINYSSVPGLKGLDLEPYRSKSTSYWTIK
jgi:putative phage-type endonuclease